MPSPVSRQITNIRSRGHGGYQKVLLIGAENLRYRAQQALQVRELVSAVSARELCLRQDEPFGITEADVSRATKSGAGRTICQSF